ncbi:N-acetyl-gamma-glutamyl-phosphate reductase [Nocardia mexicana]|uniref:N-acetyl-gamma-glutamyl-phosphate reductase n=1 Tax=Nocardia mexicana TaxID=279262 RepID=A0A370HFL5_9NOCA|nr:N-acetyl-gamma-glutamyl-phosphate reductase [Nocardia mexicana]RDI55586.1 N-acetyl-gamma-glutamyl-phosphate reductase [Nocardia mexicana]
MSADRLTVGIVGGTGHTGRELCRLLANHPRVAAILPTSRSGEPFERVHPNLLGSGLRFVTVGELSARAGELDVVFFSTPTGEAMRAAGAFHERGVKVVDLSADFRFPDPHLYERVHGPRHENPDLLAAATYGIPELHREQIAASSMIANPGCYAITAVLAAAPLLDSGWADLTRPLSIHAVNGTTGAGATPNPPTMHAAMAESMLAYNLDGHRHGPEIELALTERTGLPITVDLNTTHGPFARGIHLQANIALAAPRTRAELTGLYRQRYGRGHDGEYFVLVNDEPRRKSRNAKEYELYPSIGAVRGSNFCHLGLDVDAARGIAKVVAVTDNLVKGAAGTAIQNMNLMIGIDETTGLRHYGI